MTEQEIRIGVLGLGYVGLPLAVEFGKRYTTVGYDLKAERVTELRNGHDSTLEVDADELATATSLSFSTDVDSLRDCNVYIVTVPTPIDDHKRPDLGPLISASEIIGSVLTKGDYVIYESTVYPGATEEDCAPILAAKSGLRLNQDFFLGYSPERINPGDKQHTVTSILKVTSGSTPEATDFVDELYQSIITAGTFKASSIRVAEAAKVIENTQRDVNIALVNELALLFERLGIDTLEVLEAAGTKWNFLPFRPGLVGGHCIGVDPYYLTHKAQAIGHHSEMILAGRRINDEMGPHVAERVVKLMTRRRLHVAGANILMLGLAFKENCPDLRNSKVIDVINELSSYNANIDVYDPWADAEEARKEYGVELISEIKTGHYAAAILAVAHNEFLALGSEKIREFCTNDGVIFDVKCVLPKDSVDGRL